MKRLQKSGRMTAGNRSHFLFLLSEESREFNLHEIMKILKVKGKPSPSARDWCCVHNFQAESRPRILCLPPGQGPIFRSDMENFIDRARRRLRSAFVSEDYQQGADSLRVTFDKQEQAVMVPIYQALATGSYGKKSQDSDGQRSERRLPEIVSPASPYFPLPADISGMPFTQPMRADERLVRDKIRLLKKRCSEELDAFTARKAREAISPLIAALKKKYRKSPKVLVYLEEVGEDILRNLHAFTLPVDKSLASYLRETSRCSSHGQLYSPYTVNVLVTRGSHREVPLVFAQSTGLDGLFGSISDESDLPSAQAGFTFVRAGILHEANGGGLLVEASWILRQFHIWELLKTAVLEKKLGQVSTASRCCIFASGNVLPETIPLFTTVMVTGSSCEYSILSFVDPDFSLLAGDPLGKGCLAVCAKPGAVTSGETCDESARKRVLISARKAILALCSNQAVSRESFENHLMKLWQVIQRAQDYSEAHPVTSMHILKALREIYPELHDHAEAALSHRQKRNLAGPYRRSNGPKVPIESVKLYSGKVMTYGKQT